MRIQRINRIDYRKYWAGLERVFGKRRCNCCAREVFHRERCIECERKFALRDKAIVK